MGEAKRDGNFVPTLLAVSNADGTTPVTLYADPTTHRLLTSAVPGAFDDLSDVVITGGAQGDVLYRNATQWVNLAAGTNGHFLKTQGAAANPVWAAATAGAAGTDTQVQFNDGGVNLGGDAGFTYDKTGNIATLGGVLLSGLTASEIVGTDASKNLVSLAVATYPSLTELSYVKGLTSAAQTQITAKAPSTSPTFATSITGSYLTASEVLITDGSKNIVSAAVATYPSLTEFSYVKGVTSAIQTQLNAKGVGDMVLASVQSVTGLKTFDTTKLAVKGSSTGSTAIASANAGASDYTATLQAGTGTLAYQADVTYIGTTSVALNRASAALTLAGITLTTPDIGTPSAGVLTNCTGLPATSIVDDTTTALGIGTLELGHASDTTISRVSAGVAAIEGVNILTTAGGTLTGNITLGENTSLDLDPAGSADGKYSGICVTGTAGAALTFGQLCYLAVADSRWELADADAAATMGTPLLGMCVLAAAGDASATKMLLYGTCRADAQFPALTIGATVYGGETAGAIQTTIPTGADNIIRVVGHALTADEIMFNPSQDHQVTVA